MFTLRVNNIKKILMELKEEEILNEILGKEFENPGSEKEIYVVDLNEGGNKK